MSKYQFSSKIQLGFRQYMMVDNSSFEEGNLYEDSWAFLWLPILQSSRHKHKKRLVGIQIVYVIGSKHEYAFCIGAKVL